MSTRGERLHAQLHADTDPLSLTVLIEEACRIADRLDTLNDIVSGDVETWMRVRVSGRTGECELVIDSALSESRQQQNTLRQMLAEIRRQKGDQAPIDDDDGLADL